MDCAGRVGGDVLAELSEALAKAAARKSRPVIVLTNLARLGGSLMGLFKDLTALVMRTEPRPVLVDGSRYAATFLESLPGAVPIVVCEEEPKSESPRRVLVVEDHEDIQEFLCNLIRSAGHHAVGASSVAAAVRALDAGPIDVLFLDLKLPDGDGLDIARHLVERGLDVPVIAVSNAAQHLDPDESERCGIRRTIGKPFQVREILNAIQDVSA
ncbi:MAG TPA: response regulator [Planctomycetota bacterium]